MRDELTAAQVAERLSVGRSTVNLWCRQGRFPSARVEMSPVGGYWLIAESDLKHFQLPKRGRIPKATQPVNGTGRATKNGGKK